MINKINIYIKAFTVALVLSVVQGCSGFLEVDYPNEITQENFWQDKSQVDTELHGLYSSIQTNAVTLFLWGDLRSALYARGNHISGSALDFIKQDIRETNSLVGWNNSYKSINWINNFIENVPQVLNTDPLFTKKELDNVLAEAYTLRALNYFYLVRAFKDVPLVSESYSSNSQETDIPASSEDEVLNFIEKDLEIANQLIDRTAASLVDKYGRVNKNLIRALWADVKLWRGNYQEVISLCSEINSEYEDKLLSAESWYTIFNPGNSQESIFELQYVIDGGPTSPFWSMFSKETSATDDYLINMAKYQQTAQELYPEWPDQAEGYLCGDTIRLKDYAFAAALPEENENIEVYKYLGASAYEESYRSESNRTANFIFYRYRDVMFMEAEANALLGNYTQAEAIVNKIRASVNAPLLDAGAFGETALDFNMNLLKERQFELGFEGSEWFATLRAARQFGLVVLEAMLVDDNGAEESSSVINARLQNPESWYLPYSEAEVLNNGSLEQKPYYTNK